MPIKTLYFIIYPKIRLILKNEKIIVGNALANKFSTTHYTTNNITNYNSTPITGTIMSSNNGNKNGESVNIVINCPVASNKAVPVDMSHHRPKYYGTEL
jgi:hypothetical protein